MPRPPGAAARCRRRSPRSTSASARPFWKLQAEPAARHWRRRSSGAALMESRPFRARFPARWIRFRRAIRSNADLQSRDLMRMSVDGLESWFRKLPRDRPLLGLIAGGAFFVLASFLRWILGGISEGFGPMTFLPAILLAGLFGGIRIGLAVAALCTLVSWVMFFPPYGTFTLDNAQRITMAIFVFTAALELYVIRTLNLAINALSE